MANMNIFGRDWTNIVFEGRNKAYGAYKLREENSKNTSIALLIGIGVILLVFVGSSIYDKFQSSRASKDADTEEVKVVDIILPDLPPPIEEIEEEELPPPPEEKPADASKSVQEEKAFTETVVKKDEEVKKETKTAQEDFTDKTTSGREDRAADKDGDLKTKGEQTGGADKGSQGTGKGNEFADENKVHNFVQQKADPVEGMAKFRQAFARKFNAPDVGSGVNQIKVVLKFVVEKDGSFTDIQILNDQNGAGKEAIRVLKTMPKWKPGMHQGKAVRSSFNLPIVIQVSN